MLKLPDALPISLAATAFIAILVAVFAHLGNVHSGRAFGRGFSWAIGASARTLTDVRGPLDATPYGRQQDFENPPPGWPQRQTYE